MEQMQALVLKQDGFAADPGSMRGIANTDEFLALATMPVPVPGPGQVLIRVRRTTINPSDVAFVTGTYGQARITGTPAGFEGVGTVVGAGRGVMPRLLKGRNVAFYITPGGSGAWADYAVTSAMAAVPLKRGVKDSDAAAMLVNPVSVAAMLDLVKPGGAFVFSAAASQLGKLTASLSRDQGKRMIAIVRRNAPVATLKSLGAAVVLNETDAEFSAQLAQVCRQEAPVIFLDALGGGATASQVFATMGQGARWVIYGGLSGEPAAIANPGEMIFRDKQVEAFWAVTWSAKTSLIKRLRIIAAVQNRFISGAWSTDVAAELQLDQAVTDMPRALSHTDGKVQIVMPGG